MSSPPPSASYVPYQAYKSKRHSRNLSSTTVLVPNQSPPAVSKPSSGTLSPVPWQLPPPRIASSGEQDDSPELTMPSVETSGLGTNVEARLHTMGEHDSPVSNSLQKDGSLSPVNGPSVPLVYNNVRSKKTTFRRLHAKSHRSGQSTHSRNDSLSSEVHQPTNGLHKEATSPLLSPAVSPDPPASIPLPPSRIHESGSLHSQLVITSQILPVDSPSILIAPSSTIPDSTALIDKPLPPLQPSTPRKPAPYRPGFQPRGVYRPLTDDFLELRRSKRDGEGDGGVRRVERTKLERRLEKLITLHFPEPEHVEKLRPGARSVATGSRRASIFDFGNLNLNDAGDLWKGIVAMESSKNELRSAEQRITPWQDDGEVSKCPLCLASFHPLTNRKHHCRLCGRIICSLPVKLPQRKALCSTLFVVDKVTRQIEEVGEGVDYGVRKRRTSAVASQQAKVQDEMKFLKGVRICLDCRPTLLRQQYRQQAQINPYFVDLYQRLIGLEMDIEESLPKFQELILTLSQHDSPTREATVDRKRLLDLFAQYDKLGKKIRSLPCPNGTGSSQDRVQTAIVTRSNLFLQKNMVSLKSITSLRSDHKTNTSGSETSNLPPDADAVLAQKLQPLLEQESLLEVFIEEAQMQRKFEDVKPLKINLVEIRQEIEKILDSSDIQVR